MILKKEDIFKEIQNKRIIIEPFDENSVKDASIELTFGPQLGIFGELKDEKGRPIVIEPTKFPLQIIQTLPFTKAEYILKPNERVVGMTLEKVTLSSDICAWLTPRARKSIYELNLSISSGFIQPGIKEETLFFLITNVGRVNVRLPPRIKIVQLILMRL